MITLHYNPGAASFAVHVLLIELGTPFELALVDTKAQAHKSAAYLAMNPNGLIPVLQDGPLVLHETVAILMHLADTHAAAGLAPPLGTPERALFYKWGLWLSNTMQATLIHYFYPERMVAPGHAEGVVQVKAAAEAKVGHCLGQLDDQLRKAGGPWLLGATYSALDPMAFMLCRWTRNFAGSRPAREYPQLLPYLRRVHERPAVQRAFEREGLQPPWY
jgi:glutathione S-transferase